MKNKLKNIVFDIGGVLIGYRWKEMLIDAGLEAETAERIGLEIFCDNLWRDFDRGLIHFDDLLKEYIKKYPEDEEYINCFFEHIDLIKINRPATWKRVELLKKKGYKIYILSNYAKELVERHACDMELYDNVDGKIISYEVNAIKPEIEIYQALLDKYNLKPDECLFFDDIQDNVNGAISAGMNAQKVNSEEHINQMLDELINN